MIARRSMIFAAALAFPALLTSLGLLRSSAAGRIPRQDQEGQVAQGSPAAGRETLSWTPRPREEIDTPTTIFLGSVPKAMIDGGTAVRGFHLISRRSPLKRAMLRDGADRLLASVGPFLEKRDVRSALLSLPSFSEITTRSRSRDFSIEVAVHGDDPWSLTVIPTADVEGKEIIGAELKSGHPKVLWLSPRARGFRARIAFQRGEIEEIRIYVANRDPRRVAPMIVEAKVAGDAASNLRVDGSKLVLGEGVLQSQKTVWVDATFLREVGGSLGATVTLVARYR